MFGNKHNGTCSWVPEQRKGTRKAHFLDHKLLNGNNEPSKSFRYGPHLNVLPSGIQGLGSQHRNRNNATRKSSWILQVICPLICFLLLFYTAEKMTLHFFLFTKDYWGMINFATILFYFFEAMWILYVFVVSKNNSIPTSNTLLKLIGFPSIPFQERRKKRLNLVFLSLGAFAYAIYVSLFEVIPFTDWSLRNLILGRARQLCFSYLTAEDIPFNQQNLRYTSLSISKLILGFTGICSEFISAILQFLVVGVKIMPITCDDKKDRSGEYEVINGTMSINIIRNGYSKMPNINIIEDYLKCVKTWTRVYYLVLWGFNLLMASFNDGKNSFWARVCLFVLSIGLTCCVGVEPKPKKKRQAPMILYNNNNDLVAMIP